MDLKSIALYLAIKGMNATQITNDINATLGERTVAYSTVTGYLRSKSLFPSFKQTQDEKQFPQLTEIDEAILMALEDEPFSSIRQLARATHIPQTTVYNHLNDKLGFTVRHLRWVPHLLSAENKHQRIESSFALLRLLKQQQTRSWHDIVTIDESWFYLTTDHESIWLPAGPQSPIENVSPFKAKK
jgi:hypothetical protein